MGQRGALGQPGGPRGVLDVDRIVGRQRRAARGDIGRADGRGRRQQHVPLGRLEEDGALDGGALRRDLGPHGPVVAGLEARCGEQQPRSRLPQRELELAGAVGRVDAHHDGADARRRVLDQGPLVSDWATTPRRDRRPRSRRPGALVPVRRCAGSSCSYVQRMFWCRHDERLAVAERPDGAEEVVVDGLGQQWDLGSNPWRALVVQWTWRTPHSTPRP